MKLGATVGLLALLCSAAKGHIESYAQCGGKGWTGETTCIEGTSCVNVSDHYSQCLPLAARKLDASVDVLITVTVTSTATATATSTKTDTASTVTVTAPAPTSTESDVTVTVTQTTTTTPPPPTTTSHVTVTVTPTSTEPDITVTVTSVTVTTPPPPTTTSKVTVTVTGTSTTPPPPPPPPPTTTAESDITITVTSVTVTTQPPPTTTSNVTVTVTRSSTTPLPTSTESDITITVTATSVTVTSQPPPTNSCANTGPPASTGTLRFQGINIAGFDFGCGIDGTCSSTQVYPPVSRLGGPDGIAQMQHFATDDGFNTFRLPVGWQYLTKDTLGAVDQTNLNNYDILMQGCLATGAYCVIDIHNYARWNGGIIGQGGAGNRDFVTLWTALANKYKSQSKIMFGIMNEPHDVPDINIWADTVQEVVTAIRNTGATSQIILLPGNNWASAEAFVPSGSADALNRVTNPDGSKTNLVFDVHKYLDSDNSGTHAECVTSNIDSSWAPLANWLRCNGRQAFNTETGGGNVASCAQYLCQQVAYQKANSDVFLGYIGWSAGSFDGTYVLGETPVRNGNTWTDTLTVSACLSPRART